MRRWFILLAASLLSTNLTMLAKDVKGTVIAQKDGQPVMGAEVIVKGTEISDVGLQDDYRNFSVEMCVGYYF